MTQGTIQADLAVSVDAPPSGSKAAVVGNLREFMRLWNGIVEGSGVPRMIQIPAFGSARFRLLMGGLGLNAWDHEKSIRIADAVNAFACDEWNSSHSYGCDTFLRHIDKWLDRGAKFAIEFSDPDPDREAIQRPLINQSQGELQ